ncbi:MAG: hypothetical protein K2G64_05410 [Muribaculaceae bacterium]|nr:hypothetical protein [Muribaculaceae bacterium]MDE5968529.1 hypothetical protein [Muribaculaceae bacterium]
MNRPRAIALIVTVLIFAALIALLVRGHLNVAASSHKEWPPEKRSEVIFDPLLEEERFVETYSPEEAPVTENDIADDSEFGPSDVDSDAPTQLSHNPVNAGKTDGNATPPQTSAQESTMQVKPTDKPSGNRTPNPDDDAAAEAARQQKAKQNIDSQLSNRFSGAGKGQGKTSTDADGSSLTMSASINHRPQSSKVGTIVIECKVNPNGTVVAGSAKKADAGNSGAAAIDQALVNSCIQAAYKCQFSRPSSDTDIRRGIIRFTWSDKK